MARGMNHVMILGRLGSDPEVKNFDNGDSVANVSIATTESWKDKQGNQVKRTEWHRVVFFSKLAEIVAQYLSKGSQICIIGKLRTEKYKDKDGIERSTTKIIAEKLEMLGGTKEEKPRDQTDAFDPNRNKAEDEQHFEDDIPF